MQAASCLAGALVPSPPWKAPVVGVFSRAVSLLHPDGALVTLLRDPQDLEARACSLSLDWHILCAPLERALADERTDTLWRVSGVRRAEDLPGTPVGLWIACGLDNWTLGTAETDLLRIEVSSWCVADWRNDLAKLGLGWRQGDPDRRRLAVDCLRNLLDRTHHDGRPYSGIHEAGPFRDFFQGLRRRPDWPANLVGFGPGTTPAGDDWLGGYLTGLRMADGKAAADGADSPDNQKALRRAVRKRLAATTVAGRTLLMGCLAGLPPKWLYDLCASLVALAGSDTATGACIEHTKPLNGLLLRALSHGATSGEDTVCGLIAGLSGTCAEPTDSQEVE